MPWTQTRRADADWLGPWEAVPPPGPRRVDAPVPQRAVARVNRAMRREHRARRSLPLTLEVDGVFAGVVVVSGISYGGARSASLGYWIARRFAGQGVMPLAVAMVADHCFATLGLHRLEVDVRPENVNSRRVVEKLGFRQEGLRERLLFVDGNWRDHLVYALTAEELPGGLVARLRTNTPNSP